MMTNRLRFLTAGESHGPALTAILDGFPAGLPLSIEDIDLELARRQSGTGAGPRMKLEHDHVQILGGVMEGKTTGAPLALLVENLDHSKWQGKHVAPFTAPRPGHADLSGTLKYGYDDLRPALERASARETAGRVAVGAVCKRLLGEFGIQVSGYVVSIGEIDADLTEIPIDQRAALAEASEVRCPDENASARMVERIRRVMQERDTLGGVLEIVASGLPAGLGSHVQWDRRLEARLGAALLSIQAIKGVEFGDAFANARLPGTQVHDPIQLIGENLSRPSNRAGGLEGGMTNGMPLVMRAAMKPIATTLTPQPTVDLSGRKEVNTQYERSDFCPVPRAVPILEAMVAFILADSLLEKLGGDSLDEIRKRYLTLRQPRLSDFAISGEGHLFWP
jgi:chorismate synthase